MSSRSFSQIFPSSVYRFCDIAESNVQAMVVNSQSGCRRPKLRVPSRCQRNARRPNVLRVSRRQRTRLLFVALDAVSRTVLVVFGFVVSRRFGLMLRCGRPTCPVDVIVLLWYPFVGLYSVPLFPCSFAQLAKPFFSFLVT